MADKYHRLVSFLINLCPEPLRELLLQNAKSDTKPGVPYTSLGTYLAFRKPDILSLKSRRKLRDDQYDLLYPNSGPVDESQWDISLLAVLILELFRTNIPNQIQFLIRDIRDVRNSLQHQPKTSSISDATFQQDWDRLEMATLALAKVVNGTNYEKVMKEKIETAKVSNMADLANTLTLWFMEMKTQMMTEMKENMREISDDVKESKRKSNESVNILQKVTVVKPGPSGKPNKKMKIEDNTLKKMQDNFKRKLNAEIPEDFNAPTETDIIKEKLRDNHLVIVAGQNNSLYLAAALTAVKDMGYIEERCVEMQRSSDWNHVDKEDVEFVLCCNPFGREAYDEEKAKGMAVIFSSIQQTVKEDRDDKKLAVLMTSDIGVLNECKEIYYHDILEEVVTVYHSTSETRPTDLTVARCNKINFPSAISQNLADLTGLFLDHHERQVHPDILKAAKDKFKACKSVVLIGPQRCGKTSLAVALAASYQPPHVLLLTYPEQVQHVDQNRTHLVIIEDFAGKYGFNKIQICDWYKTFDLLHVMKSAGKLNIILTCDKQKFKTCTENIAAHPLLEHTVELHRKNVAVKQETNSNDILFSSTEDDISTSLKDILAEERRPDALKRQRRKGVQLYMNVQVVTEDYFYGHQGTDLFDLEKANFRNFRVKMSATLKDFLEILAKNLKYPVQQIRPWPFQARTNQTYRPTLLHLEADRNSTLQHLAEEGTWTVFVETASPDSKDRRLPHFDKDSDVLLFLKMYDPHTKSINYCGHAYVSMAATGLELMPELNKRAGFSPSTPLILFEEVKPDMIEMLPSTDLPLGQMLEDLMDGDIIVFQKDETDIEQYELPTAKEYFRDLYYSVEITFCDKNVIRDPGFTLKLSQRMYYDQMANSVARYLHTDPYLLQFFKPQGHRGGPGNAIRSTFEGTLKELLLYTEHRQPKKICYQQLNIRIKELENKRQFKCIYVNSRLKEEKKLVLYPDKTGNVCDLLEEAKKQIELTESGKLRLLEVKGCKIYSLQLEDMSLVMLNSTGTTKSLRIEEIPTEEFRLAPDETLIPVAHFHKEVFSTFGVPFLLVIKNNEKFSSVKDRIQKKLDVPDKEFKKYKFAVILMGKVEYISDEEHQNVNISQFIPHIVSGTGHNMQTRLWLGLDHVNKNHLV